MTSSAITIFKELDFQKVHLFPKFHLLGLWQASLFYFSKTNMKTGIGSQIHRKKGQTFSYWRPAKILVLKFSQPSRDFRDEIRLSRKCTVESPSAILPIKLSCTSANTCYSATQGSCMSVYFRNVLQLYTRNSFTGSYTNPVLALKVCKICTHSELVLTRLI